MALGPPDEIPASWVEIPKETMDELRQRSTSDAIHRNLPYDPPNTMTGIPVHFQNGHWYLDLGVLRTDESLSRNQLQLFQETFNMTQFNEWKPEEVIDPEVLAEIREANELAEAEEERNMLRAQLMLLQEEEDH